MKLTTIVHSLLCVAAISTLGSGTALAQTGPMASETDNLTDVLQSLRSNGNSYKIRVLNQAMQLTGPEADKFWPIYQEYEKELAVVSGREIALLREFADHSAKGTLDNEAADRMAQQWLNNVQARLDLWKKYRKKIAKAVSPARAAQFLQVEHQMALFIDLNIAADMPALRTVMKP